MNEYLIYVADRCASREVDALTDFYGVGRLILSGEVAYEVARKELQAAFSERGLQASTATTYISQGHCLAQLFDTFDEMCEWADDECKGSRSLKRLADTARKLGREDEVSEGGEGEGDEGDVPAPVTDEVRANSIIAIAGAMTDAAQIRRAMDVLAARLAPAAVAV